MVSETELVNRLREILRTSDLNTTSAGAVRRQLERDLGVELSDRKKFITQQIDQILQSGDIINGTQDDDTGNTQEAEEDDEELNQQQHEDENEDEDEDDDGDEDEEEDKDNKDEDEDEVVPKNTKRKGTGFTRLCSLSPPLQDFVGVSEMARTEVVKKLWAYIKEKDLQDPNNRRNIKCDTKLHSIFRVDTINMFQMNKSLSKHIWPLESQLDDSAQSLPPQKKQKHQKDEDVEKPKQKEKQKGGVTGFLIPLQLSEPFVKFLGTGETMLCRSDAVKRIWDYIKQNQLQDPSDKRRILCDEKLKELFNVDFFNGFSVTKLLTAHLTKVVQ